MGLYGINEIGGIYKRFLRSGIKPRKAFTEKGNIELSVFQINAV